MVSGHNVINAVYVAEQGDLVVVATEEGDDETLEGIRADLEKDMVDEYELSGPEPSPELEPLPGAGQVWTTIIDTILGR